MAVATTIAIYVESLGSLGGVLLLLVHNGAFANAQSQDDVNLIVRDADFILSRNEQFFAALITASVFAPLSEEFAKGLSVRFLLKRTMTRGQAFVLGAAAGAGFGFLEAMLYGLSGIYGRPGRLVGDHAAARRQHVAARLLYGVGRAGVVVLDGGGALAAGGWACSRWRCCFTRRGTRRSRCWGRASSGSIR